MKKEGGAIDKPRCRAVYLINEKRKEKRKEERTEKRTEEQKEEQKNALLAKGVLRLRRNLAEAIASNK